MNNNIVNLDKMQQRTLLVSILRKYASKKDLNPEEIKQDIEKLNQISDKNLICKLLLKEIKNSDDPHSDFCALFMLELVDEKILENQALEFLRDKSISDDKKFYVISIMRQKGINVDYLQISTYIPQLDKIAKNGIKNFLDTAINDADAQIDLLDFYLNIPKEEKLYFLNNLVEEFDGDELVNAFSVISQLDVEDDEAEIIIEALLNLKSPYAIEGIEYILKNYTIKDKTRGFLERKLKELCFANPRFVNNLLIKNTSVYRCYISFVDGYSNFSLIFSRIRKTKEIDAVLLAINTQKGVTSCMGFSGISVSNFDSILKRLFNDSIPVEIQPNILMTLVKYYCNKNKDTKTILPYEYIVWKKLMEDVQALDVDISDYINSELNVIDLNHLKVRKFASSKLVETWYFSFGQHVIIDELIEKIEKHHVTNIEQIDELVQDTIDTIVLTDKDVLAELQTRLLLQAYISKLAGFNISSSCAYSLCFNSPFRKILVNSIIDKSLYYYFSTRLYENEGKAKNIFGKKHKSTFTSEELEKLMSELVNKWS